MDGAHERPRRTLAVPLLPGNPEKEEQARLDTLAAETVLVNEQLLQVKRGNAAAEAAAQTLSGRSWFIPSPVHAIQYKLGNSALPHSLVVLGLPRVAPWIA